MSLTTLTTVTSAMAGDGGQRRGSHAHHHQTTAARLHRHQRGATAQHQPQPSSSSPSFSNNQQPQQQQDFAYIQPLDLTSSSSSAGGGGANLRTPISDSFKMSTASDSGASAVSEGRAFVADSSERRERSRLVFAGESDPNATEGGVRRHANYGGAGGDSGDHANKRISRSATAESDAFEEFGEGRKRRHSRITAWEASWNINNSIQGMFVVGFPYAILEGGYWALISILALGAVACYTGRVLVDCLYEQDGMGTRMRVRRTYSEVAATVFGKRLGPSLVNFSQLAELLMTCVIYLVLCGDLFSDSFPGLEFDIYTWILISGLLVLPYAFLQNIKHLAWISAACMAVHALMMVVVLGYCLVHISEWQWSAVTFDLNVKKVSLAIGLILSSNVAQIFLPLTEENMTDQKQFWPMLKWTFVAASIMKLLFAYIPFLTFGLATKDAVTNNLPSDGLKATVNLILILKALLTYPLPYFTSVEILGDIFFATSDDSNSEAIFPSCYGEVHAGVSRLKAWAIVARLGLIIGTLLVALFVPHFSILMSFIGSFTGTMLALVWPCMFHIKLLRSQLSYWTIAFEVSLIVFGIVCCVVGMASSGIALAEKYE